MKTRQEKCVLILLMVLIGILPVSAAGQPARAFGQTASGAGPSAQVADGHRITGEWQGIVSSQHLTVKIEQAADGSFTGKLTAVDQGNAVLPMDSVSFASTGALRFELKTIGVVYEAELSGDGGELVGTWHQGGNSIPLSFRRPGATAAMPSLKPKTIGTISFEPCRTSDGNTEGLCGKYEVYENRQLHSGRKIAFDIMVLPALADKPAADPWFALAGGPGQSAVEAFPLAGFTAKVRQLRDVVLIDQRGTGGSNPLPCELRDPRDTQAMIGESISLDKVRACRTELEKKADLALYTTSIAADDLDKVRQAMGYDKINVFGSSYGTRAALVYLRLHGNHVRTLTLEGVAPPAYRLFLEFPRTTQASIDGVIDLCAADAACHKDLPDLKKEFTAVADGMAKSPTHFDVKNKAGETQAVTLSLSQFISALRAMMYIPDVVSVFPYMIHRAHQGDWRIYGAATLQVRRAIDKSVDRGMFLSVVCAEDMPGVTDATLRRETAGTYLGDSQFRLFQNVCREWPRGDIPKDFHAPIHSAVPALFISGALDPATPPDVSAQAAHNLSNSRVVVVKDGTHGTGSPCIDGLISQFVVRGSAAALDASCAGQIHLPPFVTQTQIDSAQKPAAKD